MTSEQFSKILTDIIAKTYEPDPGKRIAEIRQIATTGIEQVNEERRAALFVEKKVNYELNGDCLWA